MASITDFLPNLNISLSVGPPRRLVDSVDYFVSDIIYNPTTPPPQYRLMSPGSGLSRVLGTSQSISYSQVPVPLGNCQIRPAEVSPTQLRLAAVSPAVV